MTSLGYWARFRRPALRSLNGLPQSPQRYRRQPCAVRSDRCLTAVDRHPGHRIPLHPLKQPGAYPITTGIPPAGASADRTTKATAIAWEIAAQILADDSRRPPRAHGWRTSLARAVQPLLKGR